MQHMTMFGVLKASVSSKRSRQKAYRCRNRGRMTGEVQLLVGVAGFEPATPLVPNEVLYQAEPHSD